MFRQAWQALDGVSYTLKFMVKQRKAEPVDYPVVGLEALWWIEDGEFSIERKDNWCWRALILQPDLITPALFEEAVAEVRKKRGDSPALANCAWNSFAEASACRCSTSAPMPPSLPPWPRWKHLQQPMAIANGGCTTNLPGPPFARGAGETKDDLAPSH